MLRKDDEKMIREEWFKDHKVLEHSFFGEGNFRIETLVWGKEGTGINRIYYVCRHSVLMVYGDLGDAIYQWYGDPTADLAWIAGCDLHYFHGKCQASEIGRSYDNYDWDEKEADRYIRDHFKQNRDCKGMKQYLESEFKERVYSKQDFHAALYEGDPAPVFGKDWWKWVPGVGKIISVRTQAHLIGLKMAFQRGRQHVHP